MPVPEDYYVEPSKKKQYTPVPEDKYQVMIYDVNPLREPAYKAEGMVDKLNFVLVILDDKKFKSTDEDGNETVESTRGRRLWRKIPRSFSPGGKYKASLFYELMCAIERKHIDEKDLQRVQPNTLIGQQLAVFVSINESYNNVESFMKIQEEMNGLPTALDQEDVDVEEVDDKMGKNSESVDEFEASLNTPRKSKSAPAHHPS